MERESRSVLEQRQGWLLPEQGLELVYLQERRTSLVRVRVQKELAFRRVRV